MVEITICWYLGDSKEKSMNRISSKFAIWYVILICFIPCFLRGSESNQLVVTRLIVLSPHACVRQASLQLEVVLTNISDSSIEISSEGVANGIWISKLKNGESEDEARIIQEVHPKSWITLLPNRSFVYPIELSLNMNNMKLGSLLQSTGAFEIFLVPLLFLREPNGTVTSERLAPTNGAIFFLSECHIPNS
jgi:hypothetical protein